MITFSCDAYENISYFNDVAKSLLSLMGHSGAVPGALTAEEVSEALSNLQQGLGRDKTNSAQKDTDDEEPQISLRKRAVPLISMLEAAVKKKCDVMWS
ncbi:DUF1840 domain-containing protein [Legionella fallonii]|uniref:DUF1840 domain-containing protein n=1 Tax=Legionella fallonii LLAP-10 TaxID=1212491 RepID=A0A098G7K7_9GAMM|nr:DUF1840 domain-containing protein [Legionella fallonii]CEG57949.1 conserved protein of unknown function [Legionella fallonii LLAP-10]